MKRSVSHVIWLVLVGACGDDGGGGGTLVSVLPAVDCPDGGSRIVSGVDDNDNGVLDEAEIEQASEVCNGAPGPTPVVALVSTTTLPPGDPTCAAGGVRIDSGLDDGANGGTAGDGVLQPEEVLSSRYVCSGTQTRFPGSLVAPAAPAGTSTIDTRGGAGTTEGGAGGEVNIRLSRGTLGGHVKVFATGTVTPTITVPALTFNAGATPLVVSADLTVPAFVDVTAGLAAASEYFLVHNDRTLYRDVAGVATEVTGIDVQAGRTLTLERNENDAFYTAIELRRDLRNAGTIRTVLLGDGRSRADLTIEASNIIGVAGSTITTAGQAATGSTGGNGGGLALRATGAMVQQGALVATGGNGDAGGNGGHVSLQADRGGLWNTGPITTSGGTGAVTTGGTAGNIVFYASYRGLTNTGVLTSAGGPGVTAGGAGYGVYLHAQYWGNLVNTGTLSVTGATCTATNCAGGNGGGVTLRADAGAITSAAAIDTSGAAGRGTGAGGDGGGIGVLATDAGDPNLGNVQPMAGSITIAGSLSTRGGAGATGGTGGGVNIALDVGRVPQGQEVVLYGYTDVRTMGGAAPGALAGDGGPIVIENGLAQYGGPSGPGGAVANHARLDSRGGDGGTGGYGGGVLIQTQQLYGFADAPFERAYNTQTIDARAGASTADAITGASAGFVTIAGIHGVDNTGAIDARGGVMTGANATGGSGYAIMLRSRLGPVMNTGALQASGGATSGGGSVGGAGGWVELEGNLVTNGGAASVTGGNGQMVGGRGGEIHMRSAPLGPTANTGALSVNGGTGVTAGIPGRAVIDGAEVAP